MITIFSDCHFGFDYGKEREDDSFKAVREVMETALKGDLILVAGDVFDSRLPRTEVWARAMEILSAPLMESSDARLVRMIGKKMNNKLALRGIPMVSIHGTHERRGKNLLNPIRALEIAGFLIHLNCQSCVFDVNGKKYAVHGMSGVPERYAKKVLERWDPKPVADAYNILLLHQSIDPYIYSPLEPPSLKIEDLPQGFDLVVDGHIHWSNKTEASGRTLVFPGSLISTQMNKIESEKPKGFLTLKNGKVSFNKLSFQRKVHYQKMEVEDMSEVEDYMDSLPKGEPKPLVRLRLKSKKSLDLKLLDRYRENFVISASKEIEKSEKVEMLQKLREEKVSVEEMGLKLLEKRLGFEVDELVDALVNESMDRAMELVKDMDLEKDELQIVRKKRKKLPDVKPSGQKDLKGFK